MSKRHPGRPPQPKTPCKYSGCKRDVTAKGFCHSHYVYLRRGIIDELGNRLREPQRVAKYDSTAICLVVGCDLRPCSRGMCNKHMLQREAGIIDAQGNQLRELLPTGRKRERESWVGSTRDGYILCVAPKDHPHARADGTILQHRLVMEQFVGRYLEDWELVHHKDGNRKNNVWENLELLDGRARSGREGHPPGSEFDKHTAIQILLQQPDLPDGLQKWLTYYRSSSPLFQPLIQ